MMRATLGSGRLFGRGLMFGAVAAAFALLLMFSSQGTAKADTCFVQGYDFSGGDRDYYSYSYPCPGSAALYQFYGSNCWGYNCGFYNNYWPYQQYQYQYPYHWQRHDRRSSPDFQLCYGRNGVVYYC